MLELEDEELKDRLFKLECELAEKQVALQSLTSRVADTHAVIHQHQQERLQFGDKLLVAEEVLPLVEEVRATRDNLSSKQLHLHQLMEGQAPEQCTLDDLQRRLQALREREAGCHGEGTDIEVAGLKYETEREEALCSSVKEQLAQAQSTSESSQLQARRKHREMFDKMLDDVVNQAARGLI